jgi:hypothetical protein
MLQSLLRRFTVLSPLSTRLIIWKVDIHYERLLLCSHLPTLLATPSRQFPILKDLTLISYRIIVQLLKTYEFEK